MVAALDEEFYVSEATVTSAFSYALGRTSGIVTTVIDDIYENAESLSVEARRFMIKLINEKWSINALGNEAIRRQWVHLLKRLQEIESESQ